MRYGRLRRSAAAPLCAMRDEHRLDARMSDGRCMSMPLVAVAVRAFSQAALRAGARVHLWTMPVEVPDGIPFDRDEIHRAYDQGWAHRFWEVLVATARVLRELSASFVGTQSSVHSFWGGMDLAATRFSGRARAPGRGPNGPRGVLARGDLVRRLAGRRDAGRQARRRAVFYAYAAPEPAGFPEAVGLLRDGTPPLQKHSPPAPHRRDVSYLPFLSVFCPAFCPGLSRARYESPSMTRS